MELLIALVIGFALGAAGCALVVLGRAEAERRKRQAAIDAELAAARTRAERATSEAQALRTRLAAVEASAARADALDAEVDRVRRELATLRTTVDRAPRRATTVSGTRPAPERVPAGPPPAHESPRAHEAMAARESPPAREAIAAATPTATVTRPSHDPVEPSAASVAVPRRDVTEAVVAVTQAPARPADAQEPTPRRRRGAPTAATAGEAIPPADVAGSQLGTDPVSTAPIILEPTARGRSSARPAPPEPAEKASEPRPDPAGETPASAPDEVPESHEVPAPGGWRPIRAGLSDPRRWLGTAAPNGATYREDDLERIHGVGPYLARRLRDAGVVTWRQVAEWSDDDMTLMSRLIGSFPDRIRREDWPASARALHEEAYGEVLP